MSLHQSALLLGLVSLGLGLNPCVRDAQNRCVVYKKGTNDGWRSPAHDVLYAAKVDPAAGPPRIDARLDDAVWRAMPVSRRYANVPFARRDGTVVVFENNGAGSWDGQADFGWKAMLAHDDENLYLAVAVTDGSW